MSLLRRMRLFNIVEDVLSKVIKLASPDLLLVVPVDYVVAGLKATMVKVLILVESGVVVVRECFNTVRTIVAGLGAHNFRLSQRLREAYIGVRTEYNSRKRVSYHCQFRPYGSK